MTLFQDMAVDLALDRVSRAGRASGVRQDERRAAFQRLVREHLVVLHGLARRLEPSSEDAEDLVQETLLRAWRGHGRFRREADVRTWFCRILINAGRDRWRRRVRQRRRDGASASLPVPVSPPDPAGRVLEREALARVLHAVEVLPRRQRECLLLRTRAGFSHREIGRLLAIREGVVKLHLVHARKTLRRRFGKEIGDWGIEKR